MLIWSQLFFFSYKQASQADISNTVVLPITDYFPPYNYRLEEFLKKEVDLELSTLPDFEERVIDVSEVEQLMNSINAVTGTLPT